MILTVSFYEFMCYNTIISLTCIGICSIILALLSHVPKGDVHYEKAVSEENGRHR